MKKLATFLFCLIISSSLFAQIQITSNDVSNLFSVGKVWYEYNSDSLMTQMNIGYASGNPQTWTIPNIAYSDTTLQINVVPSNTPYAYLYPAATHSQYWINQYADGLVDTGYIYFKITPDSLIRLGEVSHLVGNGIDTTEITVKYTHFINFAYCLRQFLYCFKRFNKHGWR